MHNDLIDQGVTLMIAGMGTVFLFLTLLVIITTLMSRLITRFQRTAVSADATDDEIAAITAAVTRHRRKR